MTFQNFRKHVILAIRWQRCGNISSYDPSKFMYHVVTSLRIREEIGLTLFLVCASKIGTKVALNAYKDPTTSIVNVVFSTCLATIMTNICVLSLPCDSVSHCVHGLQVCVPFPVYQGIF